jgi:hypothetical protein
VAADAASWLSRYRIVGASLRIDGRRESSLCLHSWFPRKDGTLARGELLRLGNGTVIAETGGRVWADGSGAVLPRHAPFLFELAGCTSALGARAATAAVDGGTRIASGFVGGRPALALRLPNRSDRLGARRRVPDRVTLYVTPRTYRPLAVSASLGSEQGFARLRLVRATPGLLARFHMLDAREPGMRP